MSTSCIKGTPRKQQIPDDRVAQVALQTRYATESGYESKPQFRKRKARHFVCNDDVAGKSELESAAEARAVNRRNGDKRSRVNRVHNGMNAVQKTVNSFQAFFFRNRCRLTVQLSQVPSRRKNGFSCAGDNAAGGFGSERV